MDYPSLEKEANKLLSEAGTLFAEIDKSMTALKSSTDDVVAGYKGVSKYLQELSPNIADDDDALDFNIGSDMFDETGQILEQATKLMDMGLQYPAAASLSLDQTASLMDHSEMVHDNLRAAL